MTATKHEKPARGRVGEALRQPSWLSMGVLVLSVLLLITAAQTPYVGVGVIGVFILVLLISFLRRQGMGWLGFKRPASWLYTHVLAISLGAMLQVIFLYFIDPALHLLTGEVMDLSVFDSMRGDVYVLLQWLALVWITVIFIEEIVFRGYLMGTLVQFFAGYAAAPWIALGLSSMVFGIAHAYQGISGILSTGLMGVILGLAYMKSGRNLWLPIMLHGWVDTVGLCFIYAGLDQLFINV
jgi:membrane protease YdiL (CAAX protease family)